MVRSGQERLSRHRPERLRARVDAMTGENRLRPLTVVSLRAAGCCAADAAESGCHGIHRVTDTAQVHAIEMD